MTGKQPFGGPRTRLTTLLCMLSKLARFCEVVRLSDLTSSGISIASLHAAFGRSECA
jgi:hypothetical protein